MKKWIIALILLVVLVAGYVWWGRPRMRLVLLGDTTAAFAVDLHDFVLQKEGRLPVNWKEFEEWETKRDGKTRWPAEATGRMVQLLSPPDDALGDCPRFVRVIDPDIKQMERHINWMIFNAHVQLGMTNGVANQRLHGTLEDSRP